MCPNKSMILMCTYSFTRIEEGLCVRTRSLAWLITLVQNSDWYSIEFSSFGKINSHKTRDLLLLLLLLLLVMFFPVSCRHWFIVAVVLCGLRPYHKRKEGNFPRRVSWSMNHHLSLWNTKRRCSKSLDIPPDFEPVEFLVQLTDTDTADAFSCSGRKDWTPIWYVHFLN